MSWLLLVIGLSVATSQETIGASAVEKSEFLDLVKELPFVREFLTDEAVTKAAPHTRVLLALTEKDLGKREIYPFLALSRGLLDRKEWRQYGVKHFSKIAHPTIKLFWGAVLFNEKSVSPEIIKFLRSALKSKEQSEILSEMVGPGFEDFQKRVKEYPLKDE